MLTTFAGTAGIWQYVALGVALAFPLSIVIPLLAAKRDKAKQ